MAWEERLFAFLDDLEGQADAAFAAERSAEVAERARAEYAVVTLASRLHASIDRELSLDVTGTGRVAGRLERVGAGWCLLAGTGQASGVDWIVRLAAVSAVSGASERSVPEAALSPLARLGLGSALRRLAEEVERCVVHGLDGSQREATIKRVGADFVEVGVGDGRVMLLAFSGLAAVQRHPR